MNCATLEMASDRGWKGELKFYLEHKPIVPATIVAQLRIEHWVCDPKYNCDPAYPRVGRTNTTSFSQRPNWTFIKEDDFIADVNLNHVCGVLTIKLNPELHACDFQLTATYDYTMEEPFHLPA